MSLDTSRPRYWTRAPLSVGLPVTSTPPACQGTVFTAEAVPAFLDAVAEHVRRIIYLSSESVGDDLEQRTDTSTARISAKLAA